MQRHVIDDSKVGRPHVRLCHEILREGLSQGFKSIVFDAAGGAVPSARALHAGVWQVFMSFPPPVYDMLVGHLRSMAGLGEEEGNAGGTIQVTLGGKPSSVAVTVRRDEDGLVELALLFPTARITAAT